MHPVCLQGGWVSRPLMQTLCSYCEYDGIVVMFAHLSGSFLGSSSVLSYVYGDHIYIMVVVTLCPLMICILGRGCWDSYQLYTIQIYISWTPIMD